MSEIRFTAAEGLQVRSWRESDLEDLVQNADNPKVRAGLRDRFPNPYTREDGISFLENIAFPAPQYLFAIEQNEMVVGGVGLEPHSGDEAGVYELGYWLGEPYWGQGIMTSVIRAVLDYAFGILSAERVFALFFIWNTASEKILKRCGMRFEGVRRKAILKGGEWADLKGYAIVREDRG